MMGEDLALALALEGRAGARGETAELVALAEGLSALPEPEIDQTWAAALEARLLTEGLDEMPSGRPTLTVVGTPRPIEPAQPVRRAPVVTLPKRRMVVRRSIAAVAAAASLSAFPVAAAASSLPGSPFYGVKRFIERAKVAMLGGPVQDAFTYLAQADTRLSEAEQMTALGYDADAISAVLADADVFAARANELMSHASDPATLAKLADEARALEQRALGIESGLHGTAAAAVVPVIETTQLIQQQIAARLGFPETTMISLPRMTVTLPAAPAPTSDAPALGTGGSTGSTDEPRSKDSGGSSKDVDDGNKGGDGKGKGVNPGDTGCEIPGSANGLGDLLAPVTKVWCAE